jgi:hypothetical protein
VRASSGVHENDYSPQDWSYSTRHEGDTCVKEEAEQTTLRGLAVL